MKLSGCKLSSDILPVQVVTIILFTEEDNAFRRKLPDNWGKDDFYVEKSTTALRIAHQPNLTTLQKGGLAYFNGLEWLDLRACVQLSVSIGLQA